MLVWEVKRCHGEKDEATPIYFHPKSHWWRQQGKRFFLGRSNVSEQQLHDISARLTSIFLGTHSPLWPLRIKAKQVREGTGLIMKIHDVVIQNPADKKKKNVCIKSSDESVSCRYSSVQGSEWLRDREKNLFLQTNMEGKVQRLHCKYEGANQTLLWFGVDKQAATCLNICQKKLINVKHEDARWTWQPARMFGVNGYLCLHGSRKQWNL